MVYRRNVREYSVISLTEPEYRELLLGALPKPYLPGPEDRYAIQFTGHQWTPDADWKTTFLDKLSINELEVIYKKPYDYTEEKKYIRGLISKYQD